MNEMITQDDAQYAMDIVKMICKTVGPGSPGTLQERERAFKIKKELESHLGDGKVVMEEFSAATDAFLGSYPVSAFLLLAAALLNITMTYSTGITPWVTAAASLMFAILSPLPYIFEYVRYYEFIDPLFKKRQSMNVIGILRKPGTPKVKRLLLISGHHDSALENTWIGLLGYGFFITLPILVIGYITMIAKGFLQMAGIITGSDEIVCAGTLGWISLIFPIIPAIIVALFFNRGRKNGGTVPGAADNLSACAIVVAMCRFLVQHTDCIPEDTEIRFISFGCEEAGLRGSRRYVARHLDELKRLDARLLNYETVAYSEISILTEDVNGVKNSPEMVKSVAAAADRAGVPYKVTPYPLGGGASDAGSFTKAGLKATTLFPCKFPQQIVAFYHQKLDTPEILTIEPLFNVLKLTLEWIKSGGE